MITTELIRSLLTMEQLEQFIQGTPEGTVVGVAADVTATDESDWAHKNVVALSLARALHVPEVCADYTGITVVGECDEVAFDEATSWVECLLRTLDIMAAGNYPRDAQRVCPVKSNGHKTRPCLSLTCAWRQQSRSSAMADDAVHGAFMTLAPYTRTREGEVPAASSLPTFAHRDRLARRIKGERASMREGQVTSLEQARCRAVFRDVRQPGSRLLASAHVCRQNLTFQGLDHLLLRVFFGATQKKRTSRSEIS